MTRKITQEFRIFMPLKKNPLFEGDRDFFTVEVIVEDNQIDLKDVDENYDICRIP